MITQTPRLWVGIDASKAHHWWVAIDDTGTTVWSRKVSNDEAVVLACLSEVLALASEVRWAVDLTGTAPALLLALLAEHGQPVVYVPGRTVNRMSAAYQGEAKTDARDAHVIADTARLRRDFAPRRDPHRAGCRPGTAHDPPLRPHRRPGPSAQPSPRRAHWRQSRSGSGLRLRRP